MVGGRVRVHDARYSHIESTCETLHKEGISPLQPTFQQQLRPCSFCIWGERFMASLLEGTLELHDQPFHTLSICVGPRVRWSHSPLGAASRNIMRGRLLQPDVPARFSEPHLLSHPTAWHRHISRSCVCGVRGRPCRLCHASLRWTEKSRSCSAWADGHCLTCAPHGGLAVSCDPGSGSVSGGASSKALREVETGSTLGAV